MKLKQKPEETSSKRNVYLSESMVNLLIKQISHELHNYTLYKTLANYFGTNGLNLLKEYYLGRANEELLHHQWIVDYLDERGVFFKYPSVAEVTEEFDEYLDAFELTLVVEEETTKLIYEIVDLAKKEEDYLTLCWLMQDAGSMLLKEQAEEIAISEFALDVASKEGSWFEKERVILEAYKS